MVLSVEMDILYVIDIFSIIFYFLSHLLLQQSLQDLAYYLGSTLKGSMKFSTKLYQVLKQHYFDLCVQLHIPVAL